MKRPFIIIPIFLFLLGFFLFKSDQFERKGRAEEILHDKCIKQFPLNFYYSNKVTGEPNLGKIGLTEYNMKIYVVGHSLHEIPNSIFKKTPCVQEIGFSFTELSTIPLAIKDLPLLQKLLLSQNHITTISDTIFKHNKLLTTVDLSLNKIKILDITPFKSIANINLMRNAIQTVLPIIQQDLKINHLELNYNNLATLDLNTFKSIHQLDLSYNQIMTVLPVREEGHNYINSLNLVGNKLTRFPIEVSSLQALTKLNLSINQIGLDPNLKKFPFEKFTMLNELDLSFNNIKVFPEKLGKMSNLTHLFLTNNQISGAVIFNGFKQLTKLEIGGQLIESFTIEAGTFPLLSGLDLTNNQIHTFEIKERNDQLEYLGLEGNQLSSVPLSIRKLKALTHLNLSTNKIDQFPDLSSLHNLRILSLSGNNIKTLPKEAKIHSNKNNFILDLSFNPISILDFERVNSNVSTLILSNCRISSFKNLTILPQLEKLDLKNNPGLTEFPFMILDYLTNLKELNLKNTQIDYATLLKINEIARKKGITFYF